MRWFLIIGVCLALGIVGLTQGATTRVYGEGSTLCSKWKASDPVQVSWVLGFMSGAEMVSPAKESTESYVQGFIGGYCSSHPTATLATAAQLMIGSRSR